MISSIYKLGGRPINRSASSGIRKKIKKLCSNKKKFKHSQASNNFPISKNENLRRYIPKEKVIKNDSLP